MIKLKANLLGGVATAVAFACTTVTPAEAVPATPLYAGGATFPEKVYRDIMNCYGDSDGRLLEAKFSTAQQACDGTKGYRESIVLFYVGVGSGNGTTAFAKGDPGLYTD